MEYKINGERATKHFLFSEIQCKDKSPIIATPESIKHWFMMEEFRVWYFDIIKPTSWDRSEDYNFLIKGSPTSKHKKGIATDFLLYDGFKKLSTHDQNIFIMNCLLKWKEINDRWGTTGAFYIYRRSVWQLHLDSRIENKFKWGFLI